MSFTEEQVAQLLQPINPRRVLTANKQSHVSQQDVRAHLIRIFGFVGWDKEILELTCVRDERITVPGKDSKPDRLNVPAVTYRCRLRLTVWCPTRCCKKISEDVGTGTAPNLPDYGDAHDFAAKNAVSYALKRCATDLGDQFGLSLYNKGQRTALVMGTLVGGPKRTDNAGSVDKDVPQQESLGDDEGGQRDDQPDAERPAPAPAQEDEEELPRRAPAEAVWAKAYRGDILRLGKHVLGWDELALAEALAEQHATTMEEADVEQLRLFRDYLRGRAELAAEQHEPAGDHSAAQEQAADAAAAEGRGY